jgi:hypothetical protein
MGLFGKTARLDALDLEVPLKFTESYHDDGYFDSMNDYGRYIDLRYRQSGGPSLKAIEGDKDHVSPNAVLFEVKKGFRINYHIACFDPDSTLRKILLAHEETHVLDRMGKLDYLSRRMRDLARVDVNFNMVEDGEVIADIGLIYVADRMGFLESIECFGNNSFAPAMNVYLQGKS